MTQQEITNYLTCDARTITEADIERVKKALKIAKIEKDITSARMKAGHTTDHADQTDQT